MDTITERQARIVEIVSQQGFATIETLARDFGVSTQSVRRDIIRLDADGLLQRFHGGVGVRETSARMDYAEKRTVATDAKHRIAARAALLVPEGSVVFLDVGTTVEAVAHQLREKQRLRVFTTSLAAANILAGRPGIDLFMLGGFVRGPDGSVAGETTLSMLSRFRFDYAVIGFSGIDRDGALMDYDLEKVAVKQAAMEQSGQTLVVGDGSKFRKSAVVRFAVGLKSLVYVTETQPPEHICEKLGGQFVIAE
ncbi:DeoR/GlpR family DNA-binding transcription regulator [Mesorhizobium sp. CAU 1741]|uniref:DeoR/GlpR family DNA-binding transcription regulator n=1 Tax=Mesorhizobium sp. CAU 1741 TaxID=3140366 RepID=UPI00325A6A60